MKGGKKIVADEDATGDGAPDEEIELGQVKDPASAATGFTCPECHGALWNINEDDIARLRCRVGHA